MRKLVQAVAALAQNAYLAFPWTRNLYQGGLKRFCTPGLNCHSCPAAVFACPLGTAQHFIAGARGALHWGTWRLGGYVWGFLAAFGLLFGRAACGWLCPFGLFQELLHRIPSPKFALSDRWGRLRLPVAVLTILILPVALAGPFGGEPWFCKALCPAGTLEAAGLFFLMPELGEQVGPFLWWKWTLLAALLLLAVAVLRPYCRMLCPLGLFYGWFNRASLLKVAHDPALCRDCGACRKDCGLGVDPTRSDADPRCIRCFACVRRHCPSGALTARFGPWRLGRGGPASTGEAQGRPDPGV